MALFYRPLTGSTQKQRVLDLLRSTYVFDVDVNLFTEDARVACAAVSKSVSLIIFTLQVLTKHSCPLEGGGQSQQH